MLLIGIIAGATLIDGRNGRRRLLATIVAAALVWGLLVGVPDGSVATFIGGTGIALANVAAGATLGVLGHRTWRSMHRRRPGSALRQ